MKNKIDKINKCKISTDSNLNDALSQMDSIDRKLLLVFNEESFTNILSIGDIQRGILKGVDLKTSISEILRKAPKMAYESDDFNFIKDQMKKFRMELMPVVDQGGNLIDVFFWEDVFGSLIERKMARLDLPVIVMAGGEGTRMKPITNIIPKPLIPFGDKSMIEQIIDKFVHVGCHNFYVSVNYKAEMIKFYFNQLKNKNYNINYINEEKPLGTAGSLHLLEDSITTTFFVSNCDILIEADYEEIYNYHKKNENELTIVSALKNYKIPYGTLETEKMGVLKKITEKPDLNYQINTGFYIVEPHLLKEIPKDEFFHITHLIDKILNREGKVGVFPVSEGSWKDIGVWDEYLKNNKIR